MAVIVTTSKARYVQRNRFHRLWLPRVTEPVVGIVVSVQL